MKKKPLKKTAAGSSLGLDLAKDKFDAALRCRMTQIAVECGFPVWTPPAQEVLALRRLSRGRAALVEQCASLRQQRLECRDKAVKKALDAVIAALVEQIAALVKAMREHVAAHPALAGEVALLESIDGIAFVSAAAILGELAPLPGDTGVRQAVAYAGLNPRQWPSGKSVQAQSRLSKTGNARLRKALYMPALTGWQCNPLLGAFAGRLLAKGKKKMQVLGALMHKLLALCCGVLKTREPFNAAWLAPKQADA